MILSKATDTRWVSAYFALLKLEKLQMIIEQAVIDSTIRDIFPTNLKPIITDVAFWIKGKHCWSF